MDYVSVAAPAPKVTPSRDSTAGTGSSSDVERCVQLTAANGRTYYMRLATGRYFVCYLAPQQPPGAAAHTELPGAGARGLRQAARKLRSSCRRWETRQSFVARVHFAAATACIVVRLLLIADASAAAGSAVGGRSGAAAGSSRLRHDVAGAYGAAGRAVCVRLHLAEVAIQIKLKRK
jgi:hypothetical protein